MVIPECDETVPVEEAISEGFPAQSPALGAVQGCGSFGQGGKDKENGNIPFQAEDILL